METIHLFAILGVLAAWVVVFFPIRRWGPGEVRRRVLCPDKKLPARVVLKVTEGEFGTIRVSDVLDCSLFPLGQLSCGKQCLSQRRA